ncbi:MAG TPA: flavin reductase family protein [Gemmatimonadales bacterium]|nr:flavin reductase family protein [Gemmatimonadales bacterium]
MADAADLFRRVTTGVYVIGVADGERRNAFTAAWLTQVSFDPLLLALSVNPEHASYPLLVGGGGFVVNVLRRDQLDLAAAFGTRSGRDQDKLAGVPWRPAPSGAPILIQALAWLDCRLHQRVPAGDHELVLARPVGGELVALHATPLLYSDTGELDGSRELYPGSLG